MSERRELTLENDMRTMQVWDTASDNLGFTVRYHLDGQDGNPRSFYVSSIDEAQDIAMFILEWIINKKNIRAGKG